MALAALDQAAALGVGFVGLTGGEPFCARPLLDDLIARAVELRLKVILVTNAYWARSLARARIALGRLRALGAARIQISLDDQHQRWIDIQNVGFAIQAAIELGFEDIKLLGSSRGNSESFKYQLFYLQEIMGVDISKTDAIDRPRVSHGSFVQEGQERYTFAELCEGERFRPAECMTELMIDVDGTVYPCCNNFIGAIGSLKQESLGTIVRRCRADRWVRRISESGPTGFARFLDAEYGTSFCKERYESWCGLCARMFRDPRFSECLRGAAPVPAAR